MRYNNYHKHSHYSNISTPDTITKPENYIKRALELNHNTYFTTEHRFGGNPWEAYDLCQKDNIKMIYGVEAYYVDNRFEKERTNYHIILIALNQESFKDINRILSESNKTGFYYKNRIDLELLLSLNPKNTIVTTACVLSRLREEDGEEKFLQPTFEHFKNNLLLEVQSHPHITQSIFNTKILKLSKKYKIPIIHSNDSHYILPEHEKDRMEFLNGKGIKYEEEDGFILDYPNYETIIKRYEKQKVLTKKQAEEAIYNTLIYDDCKDLNFNKEIKMPTLYPNMNIDEKHKQLKEIINEQWSLKRENINKEKYKDYIKGIKEEMNIIEETGEVKTVDYFLFNYEMIKEAKKLGGILTKTGRGSAPSYYINNLLGFTEIDRIDSPVPLYPTRFMSKSRILESKSLPDIDFNTSDPIPFIQASKNLLGEDGIYYMIAYGTMQKSEAFRNLCRAKGLNMDDYNEVAKNIDEYENDPKWKNLIEESKKFIGVIDSVSPSPCSFLLLDKPISEEIGLVKVGNEICCSIDGYTADVWKYLKNDYLTVTVWAIISDTYKLINKPIPDIKTLTESLDDKVWDLYKLGLTATLNQADSNFATPLVKKYSPRSVAEISAWVAAIRPGFASLLNIFLNREKYSTGIKELDEILEDSFHMMIYQESIMKFLIWCGIHEEQTYDIIKKIAKKRFKEEELEQLKKQLIKEFINKTGSEEGFNEVWQVVNDASHYSFVSAHALSMGLDSLYCAYLKANYPLPYYTVILNTYKNNINKTENIVSELPYFNINIIPIKFGKSRADYSMDEKNNNIVKGLSSLKYCNSQIAEELYQLSQNNYTNFLDLLIDINDKTSVNSRQLTILTSLNFFSNLTNNKKLLNFIEIFNQYYNKKQLKKDKIHPEYKELIESLSRQTTKSKKPAKSYMDFQSYEFMKQVWELIPNEKLTTVEELSAQKEYLGYCETKIPNLKHEIFYILDVDTKYSPKLKCYSLQTGNEEIYKIYKKLFKKEPLQEGDLIYIQDKVLKPKKKLVNEEWVDQQDKEWIIQSYYKVSPEKLEKHLKQIQN